MDVKKKTLRNDLLTIAALTAGLLLITGGLYAAQMQNGLMNEWASQVYRTLVG